MNNSSPLIYSEPTAAYIYIVLNVCALLVGVFGNLGLIITLVKHPRLQKIGREFIINLALSDMNVGAMADPINFIGVFKGNVYFNQRPVLCEITAFVCRTACLCAFLSLALLTASRMFYICYNQTYHRIFGGWRRYFYCILCWMVGIGYELTTLTIMGGHLHYYGQKCLWNKTEKLYYSYVLSIGFISIPLILIIAANIKIFVTIQSTKTLLAKATVADQCQPKSGEDNSSKNSVWTETIRACRTLFIISIAFTICWVPYAVFNLVKAPATVKRFVTLLAHSHSAINFIIYMSTNRQFRYSFLCTFGMRYLADTISSIGTSGATGTTQMTKAKEGKVSYSHTSKANDSEDADNVKIQLSST